MLLARRINGVGSTGAGDSFFIIAFANYVEVATDPDQTFSDWLKVRFTRIQYSAPFDPGNSVTDRDLEVRSPVLLALFYELTSIVPQKSDCIPEEVVWIEVKCIPAHRRLVYTLEVGIRGSFACCRQEE